MADLPAEPMTGPQVASPSGRGLVPYPYRLWMLFVNPLWWISPATEPRWTRAEFRRRARAILSTLTPTGD